MGPVLVFDKSFLESLTINESVWLDNFFLCNITPLFYVETLADLEKISKGGKITRSYQYIVIEIAKKTPIINSCPSMHHHRIVIGELLGQSVDMTNRRIQRSGGNYVKYSDGSTGIDFKHFPEETALIRWKAGEFEEIEKKVAKDWRAALSNFDFNEIVLLINSNIPSTSSPIHNLHDLKSLVDDLVRSRYKSFIYFALKILEIPEKFHKSIVERWKTNNWKNFEEFFPYSAHVLKVDLFFFIGLSKGLIGKERASSNKVDISYLYYLPFTHVFVSNDKLHKKIAPLFIKSDQSFIKGEDLKMDFKKINEYYSSLQPKIKDLGTFGFAQYPPIEIETLVGKLHDKNLIPWRESAKNYIPGLPKQDKKLIKMLKERKDTESPYIGEQINSDNVDSMLVSRKVPIKRGDWNILPKNFESKLKP